MYDQAVEQAALEQQFAGVGFDLGLDGLGGAGSDDRADGDPFGPMLESFLEVDLDDPLQVELWASDLVGAFQGELRATEFAPGQPSPTPDEDLPSEDEFFFDFVGGLSRRISAAEPQWARLLAAITPFLSGAAQSKAELDLESVDAAVIGFAAPVGRAVVEDTFVMGHETGDGLHVGLVARHPGAAEPFLAMTFVDVNLGGMAEDIVVTTELDEVRAEALSHGLVIEPVDPAEAHARLAAALQRTDLTMMAPVEDDFTVLRPLLEALMRSLPEASVLRPPVPPSDEDLAAIVAALVEDSADRVDDELTPTRLADTAGLVTRFLCRDLGRSPVEWSPATLEILLLDYVPRKIPVPAEALASLPGELAALVPAAQRAAGWEDRHVDVTLDVIRRAEPAFLEQIASPGVWEPQKRFVMRAIDEGVDLEDSEAVAALAATIRDEGGFVS